MEAQEFKTWAKSPVSTPQKKGKEREKEGKERKKEKKGKGGRRNGEGEGRKEGIFRLYNLVLSRLLHNYIKHIFVQKY
jgi:hypothetical protein